MEEDEDASPILEFSEEEVKFAPPQLTEEDGGFGVVFPVCSEPQVQGGIKPRPRVISASVRKVSGKKLCLFCMYEATSPEEALFPQDIPGAVNCPSLQKELESFFVLRQLLDIPQAWILSKIGGNGREDGIKKWFHLCCDCFNLTSQAWDCYQSILRLRSQLKETKDKLKGRIKESTKRHRMRIDSELVKEIRKYSRSKVENPKPGGEDTAFGIVWEGPPDGEQDATEAQLADPLSEEPFQEDMEYMDYSPPSHGEDDVLSDTDPVWKKPPKKRKLKKGNPPPPPKKRIRDRTRDAKPKRKRIWKKKPRKWPFHCELCPAKYKLEPELTSHKEDHERNNLNNNTFDCNFCKYPCLDLEELEVHKYDKHLKSTNSRRMNYRCKQCPFTIQFYYSLEEHVRKEHPHLPEEDCGLVPLHCKICNKISANINSAILHRKLMHPEITGALPESSLFECEECGMKFDNKIRLKYHENAHIRHKKEQHRYTCEICGKGFKWQSRLRHHNTVHNEKRQWVCSICGLDFTFKNALVRHNRLYHPQSEPDPIKGQPRPDIPPDYECGICAQKMPAGLRKRHMKLHQEAFEYKCNLCERSYIKKQALKRHQIINHSNGEHTAKCEYCNKTFIHVDYVKCHYKFCRVKNTKGSGLLPEVGIPVEVSVGREQESSSEFQTSQVPVTTSSIIIAGEMGKIEVEVDPTTETEIILPVMF